MKISNAILLPALFICGCSNSKQENSKVYSGELFTANIRTTEARTPEEERLGFKLPEGFEITLFASEPDIGKPINLAFDAKGRVWVTQSMEYPFPAEPGKGKDKLTILEDTDNDGRADRFTLFSDTLNIPIGVLPANDGAFVYSIPNIYQYTDANGDGRADKQKKLLGPFKTKDTHGMINNFVKGYDGWIHSCHGFTNRDTVAGADGDSISMISGNTFRFKPDGSRIEHTTDGRINPFGLVYDELGYLYSTDCHSSPIYQLIRNADYMQWGKEEGMGFAPDMTPLTDEATALAGIAYYSDLLFPQAYRTNFYVGDVVRCRVYRYSGMFRGSTPVGKKEEDFVLNEDPWFRPVDVKLGPDGALYIADFYNRIIGHYEVPLDHPQRDRIRGRIWRITYKGKRNETRDWSVATINDLLQALDTDNMPVRMMAADQLAERIGKEAVAPLAVLLGDKNTSTRKYIHALWILHRLSSLQPPTLQVAATHSDPAIRLHAMRILGEEKLDEQTAFGLVEKGLNDNNPHVRRFAVELLAKYPGTRSLKLALSARGNVPEYETHLLYTTRLSMRDLLRNESVIKEAVATEWNEQEATFISDVLMGVESAEAGVLLYKYAGRFNTTDARAPSIFKHMARFVPHTLLDSAISLAIKKGRADTVDILVYRGLRDGIAQRGEKENASLVSWGKSLAERVLKSYPYVKGQQASVIKLQKFAADIAGIHQLQAAKPYLLSILKTNAPADFVLNGQESSGEIIDLKSTALRALLKIDPATGSAIAVAILNDKASETRFRNATGTLLGEFEGNIKNKVLIQVKNAPPDLQANMALTLAGTSEGKDILFRKVQNKEMFPGILMQANVRERVMTNISPGQKKIFNGLTAGVAEPSKEKEREIASRLSAYEQAMRENPPALAEGKAVFTQHCAPCHSISEEGGNIGPNLDGISQWGAKPITEKVIDPNRNISENFRNYSLKMKDGKMLTGLYRRDEGATMVFADLTGNEFSVAKKDIAEKTPSKLTLMPDNFKDRLNQKDFNALVRFLMKPKG